MGLAGELLTKGNQCLRAGLFDEAAVYYTRCVTLVPDHDFARFNLGLTQIRMGQAEDGLRCIREAASRSPDILARVGEPDRLEKDASAAEGIEPFDPEEVGEELNDRPGTVSASEQDLLMAEKDARDAYWNGISCLRAKNHKGAIAAFGKSIELDPAFPFAYCDMAEAHLMQNSWKPAILLLEKAVRLKPDHVQAHSSLGLARMNDGDFEGAATAFRAALNLDPDLRPARDHLAACEKKLGGEGG